MCLFKLYRKYRLAPKTKDRRQAPGVPGSAARGTGGHDCCCCYTVRTSMEESSPQIQPKYLSIERFIGAHVLFKSYYLLITY